MVEPEQSTRYNLYNGPVLPALFLIILAGAALVPKKIRKQAQKADAGFMEKLNKTNKEKPDKK